MSLFRPNIDRMQGYVPGEQPQDSDWIKLNTNENPYSHSPRVAEAIEKAARSRLNVYPDPLVRSFSEEAAKLFNVEPDWILPANGSDENLTVLVRSFVDPGETISYAYPSYVLYESLAEIQGCPCERLLLNTDWSWDLERIRPQVEKTKLLFVPNPNSPSGTLWDNETLVKLIPPKGVLVLDQAYGDFCSMPDKGALLKGEHGSRIVITRTLSKSYSLAGIRFGFAVAHPELISGMRKVKDSYNCNTLSIAAAVAALQDQEWMLKNTRQIQATRERLTLALRLLGFDVVDSQTNFVWATHPERDHEELYQELKARRILVRYMKFPETINGLVTGLRITIGTDAQIDTFLEKLKQII
ncbi:MAG: histidinol-phosphate transaminase [Planctomycetaceae bacterium]|nr:histidinol-phosphate transaminase [Planctomycetaceae bacterium]